MKKGHWILVAVAVVAIGSVAGYHYSGHASAATSTCVAGPHEQCVSDLFLKDFDDWQVIQEKIKKYSPPKDLMIESEGRRSLLAGQIPAGWDFDVKKRRLVEKPAPAPGPAPAAPAPASPPK